MKKCSISVILALAGMLLVTVVLLLVPVYGISIARTEVEAERIRIETLAPLLGGPEGYLRWLEARRDCD